MSDVSELGAAVSEHRGRLAAGGVSWYVGGILFVSSIVGLFNTLLEGKWIDAPFFLLLIAGVGLWILWLFAGWRQSLTIHSHGFVWNRLFRAPLAVRFADIASVEVTRIGQRKAMHLKGVHIILYLSMKSGKPLKITNDMKDVEQLAGYIQSASQSATAPGAAPGAAGPPASPWG